MSARFYENESAGEARRRTDSRSLTEFQILAETGSVNHSLTKTAHPRIIPGSFKKDRHGHSFGVESWPALHAAPVLRFCLSRCSDRGGCSMMADSSSDIAWHRVQLKKNRDAVKALETARFTVGETAASTGPTQKAVAGLKRKIEESQRCIAAHERQTRRPVATDLRSLANVSWSSWNTHGVSRR